MSEFELTVLRRRLLDAAVAKARRGELRMPVPVGYVWSRESGLALDPDRRVQDAIRTVFRLFERFGTARQVLLHMQRRRLPFPRPSDGKSLTSAGWSWRPPCYRNVISVLQNPFYAGAYAYGKAVVQTKIVDGSLRKSYGHRRPMNEWTVLLRDHHEAYVSWEHFERTQGRLAELVLEACRRCEIRPWSEGIAGRAAALSPLRPDADRKLRRQRDPAGTLRVPPWQFDARSRAVHHFRRDAAGHRDRPGDPPCGDAARRRSCGGGRTRSYSADGRAPSCARTGTPASGVRSQARGATLESVDPDNRLVAAELEARWNAAITRLRECEARIAADDVTVAVTPPSAETLLTLAADLEEAWNAPTATTRTKQRLVRTLVEEIVVDVDDSTREVVLIIHWRGGQHSELRVRKPKSGEHRKRAPMEADSLIREMAGTWSDEHVAATLNRMGLRTGQGMSWTKRRVEAYRKTAGIAAYAPAANPAEWVTMRDAAKHAGISSHFVRQLIQRGVLPAKQVVPDAPWQIRLTDLDSETVRAAIARRHSTGRPCEARRDTRTLVIPGT